MDNGKIPRRNFVRGALCWTTGIGMMFLGGGGAGGTSAAVWASASTLTSSSTKTISQSGRLVDQVEPNEKEIYAEAQNRNGLTGDGTGINISSSMTPKRILWVGSGDMRRGVSNHLFEAGNEVIALDLIRPDAKDIHFATRYATEYGYQLRFEQGDATNLKYQDDTFDAVVSSMFLCQEFDPEIVVSEIRRVLKPDGRFGFYEHVEDIDRVIIDKVFGERSIIRIQADPERTNIIAGIVRKV